MKKILLLLTLLLPIISKDLHRINSIEAIVPTTGHIVTSIDIMQRGFDSSNLDLEEIILEHLLELYGQEVFAINVDDEMIDRYLEKMGLKQAQLEYMADMWLFADLPDFYSLFKRVHASGGTMQQLIESLVTITEEFLQKIYQENPQWREPAILIQTAGIPLTDKRKEKLIRQYVLEGDYHKIKNLKWDEESWIPESEIDSQVKFLTTMQAGDIASRDFGNELVLYKIVQKRDKELVPLAERRKELLKIARERRYEEARQQALDNVKDRYVVADVAHSKEWQEAEVDPSVAKPM